MACNCENCKFYDVDCEWDDKSDCEDEIAFCLKRHRLLLYLPFKCPYFEGCEPKPYVEQFTECDKCEYVKQCESEGHVINCARRMDSFEHFVRGRNAYCRKVSEPFEDKRLSEIIDMVEDSNNMQLKDGKELLQTAIEKFGDITYKEFMKDKTLELYDMINVERHKRNK